MTSTPAASRTSPAPAPASTSSLSVPRSTAPATAIRPGRASALVFVAMVVAVLLSTGALLSLRVAADPQAPGAADVGGDALSQAIWGLLYVVGAVVLVQGGRLRGAARRFPVAGWLLLALAVASVAWSADPPTSLRRCIALAGSTVLGFVLGTRFDRAGFLRVNAAAIAVAVVLSYVWVLAWPDVGIAVDVRGEAWRGVFSHKNTLGLIMSWGVAVTALTAFATRSAARWGWWAASAGALGLLAMSGSRTGLLVLVAGSLACWALTRWVRAAPDLAVGAAFVAVPVAVVVALLVTANFAEITQLVGRDASLTGRSTIWRAVLASIEQRPWTGYGFEAFWGGLDSPAREVWARMGVDFGVTDFRPRSAHDGWLNLWLQLGAAGVVLFAWLALVAVGRTLRAVRDQRGPATAAPLLFVLLYLLFTTVEGAMLTPNNLFWVVLVAVLVQAPVPAPQQGVR